MPSLSSLSDAWFIISEYMFYSDIVSLSVVNKEANALMNNPSIWELQCQRYFNTNTSVNNNNNINNNNYKSHFRHFIELYGHDACLYYNRVIKCWNELKKWSKINLPKLINDELNSKANKEDIKKLKEIIGNNKHLTPYLILLGECCNGQKRNIARLGLYGYYSFYGKQSSGHLLSINDSIKYTKQVIDVYDNDKLKNSWLFCAGIPNQDRSITIPCLTFIDLNNGKICKITQDSQIIYPEHNGSKSFMNHLEFYILNNLILNNYRINIENNYILRFPLKDNAVSNCMDYERDIITRASPIFIPEISNIIHKNYIFPYHIEIECPSNEYLIKNNRVLTTKCPQNESKAFQLTHRKWSINDNGNIEKVEGPGVIGLFPKVFINQQLFEYQSCSQQNTPSGGSMWGSFLFKRYNDEYFELEIKPYKLDWNQCQWI